MLLPLLLLLLLLLYVLTTYLKGGCKAPPFKYMVKYIQQKQQQKLQRQHANLLWQIIQLSIPKP